MHILGEKSKEPQTRTAELKRAKPYRPKYNHVRDLAFSLGAHPGAIQGFSPNRMRP